MLGVCSAERCLRGRYVKLSTFDPARRSLTTSPILEQWAIEDQKRASVEKQRQLNARIRELEPVRDYLDGLSRVPVYTRTRFDYERSITRLTREQQRILEQLTIGADFLIKGSVGNGKTQVLTEALEKARSTDVQSLEFDLDVLVALLNFTYALVKNDRYIAAQNTTSKRLSPRELSSGRLSTASAGSGRLQRRFPAASICAD